MTSNIHTFFCVDANLACTHLVLAYSIYKPTYYYIPKYCDAIWVDTVLLFCLTTHGVRCACCSFKIKTK